MRNMPIGRYGCAVAVALAVVCGAVGAHASSVDLLAVARQAYNAGEYEASVAAARQLLDDPSLEDPHAAQEARVVLGRALVEIYRLSGDLADLAAAREAFVAAATPPLRAALRVEWLVGTAAALYFDDAFGASAETFASVLEDPRAAALVPGGRERLIDWWATAHDRALQRLEGPERREAYGRFADKLRMELYRDASLGVPAYWLVIAARGAGDLEQAWVVARAAWVRALLAPDLGAALRADLERLMVQAIIPERARRAGQDQDKQVTALTAQWEEFKRRWSISYR
jgi:hypothetical protein